MRSIAAIVSSWGTATECQAGCTPTIDPHYYYDTVITLESGDFSYGQTVGAGGGASHSGFVPNEDGSEWRIDEIYIPIFFSPPGDPAAVPVDGPVDEIPVDQPTEETPVDQPTDETPAEETPVDQPTEETPAEETPVDQTIEQSPGTEAPLEQQMPSEQPTPVQAPVEPATPTSAPPVAVPTTVSAPAPKPKKQPREPRWLWRMFGL